jgi:hypothetical protein
VCNKNSFILLNEIRAIARSRKKIFTMWSWPTYLICLDGLFAASYLSNFVIWVRLKFYSVF